MELILSVPASLVCLSSVYTFFLLVITFAVFKRPDALFLRLWALTFWAPAVGGVLVILRPVTPFWVSEYLACMLFVLAISCAWLGMRSFWHRPLIFWLPAAAVFGVIPVGLASDQTLETMALSRQLYIFAAAGLFYALTAYELRRKTAGENLPSKKLARWVFSSFSALHVLALPFPVLFPIDFVAALPVSPWLFGLIVLSMLHTVAATFMCLVLGKERAEAEVQRLADTDVLTGLSNRRAFIKQAEVHLKAGRPGTLLILDLDRFKQINDQYGHSAGDTVLLEFANFLQSVAGGSVHVGRLGGEEFGIFIANRAGPDLDQLAQQICVGVSMLRAASGSYEIRFTTSIGITDTLSSGWRFRKLFEDADEALYQAKRNGRNGYHRHKKPFAAVNKVKKPQSRKLRKSA